MVLHGFEGRLMSKPRVLAAAGHGCAAMFSSTGGERTYPWASAYPRGKRWYNDSIRSVQTFNDSFQTVRKLTANIKEKFNER